MASRYYIDSCIWRDYFENRSDKFRPLGEWAFLFFKKIVNEDSQVVVSDHLINEMKKNYSAYDLNEIFSIIPLSLIIKVETSEKQAKEAYRIMKESNIHFDDALHAVLAKDNNAILVSRDKHFHELQEQITVKRPEDLI